jgi:hypothetical protein
MQSTSTLHDFLVWRQAAISIFSLWSSNLLATQSTSSFVGQVQGYTRSFACRLRQFIFSQAFHAYQNRNLAMKGASSCDAKNHAPEIL